MKIRVSNSLFVILVSAVLWQPVSAAADSYDPPARVARLSYSRGSVSFQPAGDSEWVDAFFKAYQKLEQFHGHATFSTWLVRIALNESFTKLRKRRGILEQSVDSNAFSDSDGTRLPFDVADWAPNPEAQYRATELREILISTLQRLTPALKIVFVLRDIEEYSLSETSEILNLSATAVKTRLSRARLQLREELSKYFKQPE